MSQSLKEYLIGLGFQIDEPSWRKFNNAIGASEGRVVSLAGEAVATGLALGAMVERVAREYENLYYISQRTGATVTNLKAFRFAATQVGMSMEEATSAIEGFSGQLRMSPGAQALLRQWGITTKDTTDQMMQAVAHVRALAQASPMGYTVAASMMSQLFGMDERTFNTMLKFGPIMEQERERQRQMMKDAGFSADDSAEKFTNFGRSVNTLQERLSVLGSRIALDFLPTAEKVVKAADDMTASFTRMNTAEGGKPGEAIAIAGTGGAVLMLKKLLGMFMGKQGGALKGSSLPALLIAALSGLKSAESPNWSESDAGTAMHQFRYLFRDAFGMEQEPEDEARWGHSVGGRPNTAVQTGPVAFGRFNHSSGGWRPKERARARAFGKDLGDSGDPYDGVPSRPAGRGNLLDGATGYSIEEDGNVVGGGTFDDKWKSRTPGPQSSIDRALGPQSSIDNTRLGGGDTNTQITLNAKTEIHVGDGPTALATGQSVMKAQRESYATLTRMLQANLA